MKLFDTYMEGAGKLLAPYLNTTTARTVSTDGPAWPLAEKNPFIMERDTAVELGGYPKESVNLIVSSSGPLPAEDLTVIESAADGTNHISFGRVVFLQTEEISDEQVYEFQQAVQLADLRLKLQDAMTRTSSRQYQMNLRIGKKAAENGLDLDAMARSVQQHFLQIPQVKKAAVFLIAGESSLYRELLPVAEKVKDVTVALNTMFDGIDMDCGSCSLNEICDEVEGLRELHRKKQAETV